MSCFIWIFWLCLTVQWKMTDLALYGFCFVFLFCFKNGSKLGGTWFCFVLFSLPVGLAFYLT